jgi:hypothetical protein
MKFQEYRPSINSEPAPKVEVTDREGLLTHLRQILAPYPTAPPVRPDTVQVVPYLFDSATGTHIHMVRLHDYGLIGTLESPRDITDH